MSKASQTVKTIAVSILLSILIVSFAITGVGANIFVSSQKVLATVGKSEVETADVVRATDSDAREYQIQLGGSMSSGEIIRALGLHIQNLNQQIAVATLDEAAREMGIRGTEEQMVEYLQTEEAFQLLGGQFNLQTMRQVLQSNNIQYQKFEKDQKKAMARQQVINAMVANTNMPSLYADALYSYRNELRSADLLTIPQSLVSERPTPEEGDLEAYYEANKANYMAPESRDYSYMLIMPDAFEDGITPDEELLQREYDYRKSEYVTPEIRELLQVSFDTKEEANAFIDRVNDGEDFVELAAELTEFEEDEINIGEFDQESLTDDYDETIAETVFTAELDVLTTPLESFGGYSIFQVITILEGSERTFAEVRDELAAVFIKDEAQNRLYEYLGTVEDAISEYDTIDEVATAINRDLAVLTGIRRDGSVVDSDTIISGQLEQTILADAFTQEYENFLEVKEVTIADDRKASYVLQVKNITDARQKEFDEVKDDVLTAWQDTEMRLALGEIAENALERINAGESFDDVMQSIGGTTLRANNVRRTGTANDNIAPQIRSLIFSLDVGEADMGSAADGDGFLIVRVDKITPGKPEDNTAMVNVLKTQLENSFENEILIQLQQYLMNRYTITVNNALLEQTFSANNQQYQ